jgi:hypothetical protein
MVEFRIADFAPLDDFPLLWRWTSPSHAQLPVEVLREIQALTAAAASAVAPEAASRCAAHATADWSTVITAEAEREDPVRDRLRALPIDLEPQVLVSWDARAAVVTRWRVFVDYWTDFCYPSSDDVTVWAPGESWTLCYRHFETFEFGITPRAT